MALEFGQQAGRFVVVTQAEINDLDEEFDRDLVLSRDFTHGLRLLEVLNMAELVEVLFGLVDHVVILVQHGVEPEEGGIAALLLPGFLALALGNEVVCLRHRDLDGDDAVLVGLGCQSVRALTIRFGGH